MWPYSAELRAPRPQRETLEGGVIDGSRLRPEAAQTSLRMGSVPDAAMGPIGGTHSVLESRPALGPGREAPARPND